MTIFQSIREDAQALREEIKSLSIFDLEQQRNGTGVTYKGGGGKVIRLLKKEHIAICDAPYPAGSSLALHQHDAVEVIIVYEGELEMEIDGEITVVGARELMMIPENVPHRVKNANKASRCIGVTMPADQGYP